MKTRKQILIDLLNRQDWVCSTEFQSNYVPEFRSIISRMNKYEHFNIISEPCLNRCGKNHNSSQVKRWRMEYAPAGYFLPQETKNESEAMKFIREEYKSREKKFIGESNQQVLSF